MLAACSDNEGDGTPSFESQMPISFSTDVSLLDTRATTGPIESTDDLKKSPEGFGVFAYLTESKKWNAATSDNNTPLAFNATDYPIPDFMNNQQVTWGKRNSYEEDGKTKYVEDWTYSPPKYWPNSNDNATARYISFFAYAPYGSANITALPDASDKSPHLTYTLSTTGTNTDLLWANCTDATRNGNGLIEVDNSGTTTTTTYEKVPLTFHHALACVDIYVRRLYDETTPTGKTPSQQTDTLFISQLTLDAGTSAFYSSGTFDLATGTWRNLTPLAATNGHYALTYTEGQLLDSISGTAVAGTTDTERLLIRDRELDKVGQSDPSDATKLARFGVDSQERRLFPWGTSLMFFPQTGLTITPTLTYSMVTHDDDLLLSSLTDTRGRIFGRRLNTVKGNPVSLSFEAGKRYKLVLLIGVEHIEFEVTSVVDWDFPLRANPSLVEDFKQEGYSKTMDEE